MRKIFGIGLSRTGSASLTDALTVLGYRAVHFPADPVTQGEYARFLAGPSRPLRLSVLDRCDALTDTPLAAVYRQLDRAYPGSKFILTVREKESWLRSCELWWERAVVPFMEQAHPRQVHQFMRLAGEMTYGTAYFDPVLFARTYDAHLSEVTRYFSDRRQDLLVLDICAGAGWLELAPFLGRKIPDVPFPHRNQMIPDLAEADEPVKE